MCAGPDRKAEPTHTDPPGEYVMPATEPRTIAVDEVAAMLADLRDISGRMARFEPVPQEELDAFEARKRVLVERIEATEPLPAAEAPTGAGAMFTLPGAPLVSFEPAELAGEWEFVLAAFGHRQRMRETELVALYRACDTALNARRKAVQR